jgi:chromosome segregation ATPase
MEDTNLSGLDLEAAREYIFAYSVDLKRLDKAAADSGAELERWKSRVALVEDKLASTPGDASLSTLAEAARAKVAEEEGKLSSLEAERSELRGKINLMREQLPMIKARERSVDPDRLLAELQMMTGELLGRAGEGGPDEGRSAAATEADFAKLEADAKADAELEDLKRRAAAEGESGEGGEP